MSETYERWQYKTLISRLKERRVVLLAGPRQCGKTTLAKKISGKDVEYRTLDNKTNYEFALSDPSTFVKHSSRTLIIDEVQKAPDLLPAIKEIVDEDMRPGQYLLTGSANIQALPSVTESLAGRVSKIRLRPLSQGEILGKKPDFLSRAYAYEQGRKARERFDRDDIFDMAFKGGFPEAIKLDDQKRQRWHRDYTEALIERDLREIQKIQRQEAIRKLVEVLAAWSSKYMDISAIASVLSIARPTLYSYISALENLYLVEKVNAWTKTDYDRIGKQEKIFMSDSGLMASLLRWDRKQVGMDADRLGKLFETFAFNEIAAQVDVSDGTYKLFHYRDRERREIDFLVEREDQALLGIEVKASASVQKEDFKHLKWFKDNLAKGRPFTGIVLYAGESSGSMGEDMWAVPFYELWG